MRSLVAGLLVLDERLVWVTRFDVTTGPHPPARIFLGVQRGEGLTPRDVPAGIEVETDGYHVPLVLTPSRHQSLSFVEEGAIVQRTLHAFELEPESLAVGAPRVLRST